MQEQEDTYRVGGTEYMDRMAAIVREYYVGEAVIMDVQSKIERFHEHKYHGQAMSITDSLLEGMVRIALETDEDEDE